MKLLVRCLEVLNVTCGQVHIEFTDGEERIILEGPTEEVEQAQAQIQEIINDLVREFFFVVGVFYYLFLNNFFYK